MSLNASSSISSTEPLRGWRISRNRRRGEFSITWCNVFKDGRISAIDFLELKHWLESDPDVPEGKWFKRFKTGILAGEGDRPLTFLAPGMVVNGDEVE
jgi:hypothetical protein